MYMYIYILKSHETPQISIFLFILLVKINLNKIFLNNLKFELIKIYYFKNCVLLKKNVARIILFSMI